MNEVKALVDRLVASGKYQEEHRATLTALGQGFLEVIAASCGCTAAPAATPTEPPTAAATPPPSASPASPATASPEPAKEPTAAAAPSPKQLTEAELLEQLPPERREMYAEAFAEWDSENERLRTEIEKHRPGVFTAEELKAKSRKELKQIHALAAPPAPDFSGQGLRAQDGTATSGSKPTQHASMPPLAIARTKAA